MFGILLQMPVLAGFLSPEKRLAGAIICFLSLARGVWIATMDLPSSDTTPADAKQRSCYHAITD
jgi:hypothetical protein